MDEALPLDQERLLEARIEMNFLSLALGNESLRELQNREFERFWDALHRRVGEAQALGEISTESDADWITHQLIILAIASPGDAPDDCAPHFVTGADESLVTHVDDRPGHDRRYSLDTTKLRGLGWRPERDFEHGLAATVEWYRERREWWEPLKSGEYRAYYAEQYGNRL